MTLRWAVTAWVWASLAMSCLASEARVLRVDAASADALPDGSSWSKAFPRLSDALKALTPGEPTEIWIARAAKPYKPDPAGLPDRREASFVLAPSLAVYGGFKGLAPGGGETSRDQRDPAANETVLSGDLDGDDPRTIDNCYHVVRVVDAGDGVILDGLTIASGNTRGDDILDGAGLYCRNSSPRVMRCRFVSNKAGSTLARGRGGGLFCSQGNPIIEECTFGQNYGEPGAGLHVFQGAPQIRWCTFTENDAQSGGKGAGAGFDSSDALIEECSFQGNQGSAIFNLGKSGRVRVRGCNFTRNRSSMGAGVANDSGLAIVEDCEFIENTGASGGGVGNMYGTLNVSRCLFRGNSVSGNGGGAFIHTLAAGGGYIADCSFIGNSAWEGGGAYVSQWPGQIVRCSFADNTASRGAGALYLGSSTASQCLFGGNQAEWAGAFYLTGSANLSACMVAGNTSATDWCAVVHQSGTSTLANSLLVGNQARISNGAAVRTEKATARIVNCTVAANDSVWSGAGILQLEGAPAVTNTIIWGNTVDGAVAATQIALAKGVTFGAITYSCVQDANPDDATIPFGGAANHNIDDASRFPVGPVGTWSAAAVYDPLTGRTKFTDARSAWPDGALVGKLLKPGPASPLQGIIVAHAGKQLWVLGNLASLGTAGGAYVFNDYRPGATSPCLDAGDNGAVPTWSLLDLDGRPRVMAGVVDMGAYEWLSLHPADFDRDGDVDQADAALFRPCLSGPAIPLIAACASCDLDHDGDVDQSDQGILQRCVSGPGRGALPGCAD